MQGQETRTRVSPSDRRWALFGPIAVAVFGVILAVFGGIVPDILLFYIVGIAFSSIALVFFVVRMTGATYAVRRIRVRVGALAVVVALTAAVVLVPWAVAEQRRSVDAQWTGSMERTYVQSMTVDGKLVFHDTANLRAIDLDSGEELWSRIFDDGIDAFYLSDDGHVLVITQAHGASWLAPDGEQLWTWEDETPILSYVDPGVDFVESPPEDRWVVVAAKGDTVVLQQCVKESTPQQCTFRGIDSGGEVSFEIEAPYAGEYRIANDDASSSHVAAPQAVVLPPMFLTSDEHQDEVYLRSADTGQRETGTGIRPMPWDNYVDGDVLVQKIPRRVQGRGRGSCQMVATRIDGTRLWQSVMPCFDAAGSDFIPGWIYTDARRRYEGGTQLMVNIENGEIGLVSDLKSPYSSSAGNVYASPDVAFYIGAEQFDGIDPESGEHLWSRDAQDGFKFVDQSVIGMDYRDSYNPFIDEEESVATVIDPETGETITSVLLEEDSEIWPVATGQALVWQDGQLALIGG